MHSTVYSQEGGGGAEHGESLGVGAIELCAAVHHLGGSGFEISRKTFSGEGGGGGGGGDAPLKETLYTPNNVLHVVACTRDHDGECFLLL